MEPTNFMWMHGSTSHTHWTTSRSRGTRLKMGFICESTRSGLRPSSGVCIMTVLGKICASVSTEIPVILILGQEGRISETRSLPLDVHWNGTLYWSPVDDVFTVGPHVQFKQGRQVFELLIGATGLIKPSLEHRSLCSDDIYEVVNLIELIEELSCDLDFEPFFGCFQFKGMFYPTQIVPDLPVERALIDLLRALPFRFIGVTLGPFGGWWTAAEVLSWSADERA